MSKKLLVFLAISILAVFINLKSEGIKNNFKTEEPISNITQVQSENNCNDFADIENSNELDSLMAKNLESDSSCLFIGCGGFF